MEEEIVEKAVELYPVLRVLALSRTRNREAAEDLVQEVLTRCIERPQMIAASIRNSGVSLEMYLKRAVVNRHIDFVRRGRHFVQDDDYVDQMVDSVSSDPTRRSLLLKDLTKHLLAIGDECSQLLIDRANGFKQDELARMRNLTQSAINKRIAKCLRALSNSSGGIFNEA